jgi:hypothetical protein
MHLHPISSEVGFFIPNHCGQDVVVELARLIAITAEQASLASLGGLCYYAIIHSSLASSPEAGFSLDLKLRVL